MKFLDKHLKYFTAYAGIIYALGFLILSTRLAFVRIFIKDFLTLDYIKAGLLFVILNIPIYVISSRVINLKGIKLISMNLLDMIFCVASLIILTPWLFTDVPAFSSLWGITAFFVYPIFMYILIKHFRRTGFEEITDGNGFGLGLKIIMFILSLNLFSIFVFPLIDFRYGGGAPYEKTLFLKTSTEEIDQLKGPIYYENDSWIYMVKDGKTISLPRSRIIQEESTISNKFLQLLQEELVPE